MLMLRLGGAKGANVSLMEVEMLKSNHTASFFYKTYFRSFHAVATQTAPLRHHD